MIGHKLGSFLIGLGFGRAAAPFVEWSVHRYMLHPKTITRFNKAAARGHTNHHRDYSGVHYFEDENNKDAVSHFSVGDVALIHGIAAAVGAGINAGYAAAIDKNPDDIFFTAGVVASTAYAYGKYEFLHWLMHKVDEPRKKVHLSLGDILQPEGSDGKLRNSRPLLNQLYEEVYTNVRNVTSPKGVHADYTFSKSLEDKLEAQLQANAPCIEHPFTPREVLVALTNRAVQEEKEKQLRESYLGGVWRGVKQYATDVVRNSKWFQKMDNHHVVHHFLPRKNLNVVFEFADYLFGTKVDSRPATLDANKEYWMCPNPKITKESNDAGTIPVTPALAYDLPRSPAPSSNL